jgi:hypothetical protein
MLRYKTVNFGFYVSIFIYLYVYVFHICIFINLFLSTRIY